MIKNKFGITLLIYLIVLSSCNMRGYKVGSGSLSPNINVGDYVFIKKENIYNYGDAIVFWVPDSLRADTEPLWVYRVVALPDDTISIEKNHIIVNNENCNYSFIKRLINPDGYQTIQEEEELPNKMKIMIWIVPDCSNCDKSDMASLVVPQDHYFVLGDYRTGSLDSRYIGSVPIENIKGKVTKVIRK